MTRRMFRASDKDTVMTYTTTLAFLSTLGASLALLAGCGNAQS